MLMIYKYTPDIVEEGAGCRRMWEGRKRDKEEVADGLWMTVSVVVRSVVTRTRSAEQYCYTRDEIISPCGVSTLFRPAGLITH